ncbi:MAG TPA: M48 family metalloprotease [Anaeromyxobacteraceae bacterium]|nr:M48 family metalloprotease [Anaeromyxobacteraceae bacterium]
MSTSRGWFAARALLALALLVGFYLLALGIAAGLLWVPYAEWAYAKRVHPKLALVCLAGAFVILKATLFVPRPKFEPPGPEIEDADQPVLFALIRKVARRMGTAMPRHVFLLPDVNAFVTEVGGFLGLGTTRVMGIGVGLLGVDSVSQLEATIAHEFGHFAGGDTRLGGLVYRTRAAIGRVLESLEDGWLSKPFAWYGKLFLAVSHGVSRQQELLADRAGVEVAGREAHVTGLEREARGAVLFDRFWAQEVVPLLDRGFRPDDLYQGFRGFAAEAERQGQLARLDEALAREKTGTHDTHPALSDRIAFARALPDPGIRHDTRPARDLLRNPEGVEKRMTEHLAGRIARGEPFHPVAWVEVAAKVYAPGLAERGRELAGRMGGAPTAAGALRALVARLESSRDEEAALAVEPELAGASPPERSEHAPRILAHALGSLLGQTLVEAGGTWRSEVGRPLEVELDGERVEPWRLAAEALEDRSRLRTLLERVRATS